MRLDSGGDCHLDCTLEMVPSAEYGARRWAECVKAHECDVDVLQAIGLESLAVMLVTVDLNRDNAIDHQVNSPTVNHRMLRSHRMAAQSQPGSDKTLGQGFALRINPVPNPTTFERQSEHE
jgi:hypothetical protein